MLKTPILFGLATVLLMSAAHADDAPVAGSYTFIAPGDNTLGVEEFACGVRFGMRQVINNVQGARYGELKRIDEGSAELTTFVGSQDFGIGKGVRHPVGVKVEKTDDQCMVFLDIKGAEPFKKGLIYLGQPPSFSAADVLVETHKFLYRPSFTSDFPADSLMANFDRLAVKSCNNVGHSSSRSIPSDMTGGFEKVYCVKTSQGYVPTVPECAPYRNGSRCTVLAVLIPERNGNTFDARSAAQELRSAVDAILLD